MLDDNEGIYKLQSGSAIAMFFSIVLLEMAEERLNLQLISDSDGAGGQR
jgi:hypothetical protein